MILTLTTDFGISDGYVAAMKGVVLTCAPDARIVDITHQVPPQDIAAGAFAMYCACPFFPKGSVHIGVVDPGIVVETERFVYVGPDNGLFSPVYEREIVRRIVAIENTALMRPQVSSTFHGRDVFALVGAHLLRGVSCEEVGTEIEDPVICDLWGVEERADALVGRVVCVDHFGNAISMIARAQIDAKYPGGDFEIIIGKTRFDQICQTYSQVKEGEALALYGSLDTLEIAVCGGSAGRTLGVERGDEICVYRGQGRRDSS
ncbi:MAG: SAM-dependent chlorinase/fluorinase [Candidatus Latescibacteria bacterium]|nr:SAM-dependent chlorinase/fluorinase [Candidatus Latescibacterota bacterium]